MAQVFVYGTLKTGFPNHFLLKDEENGRAKLIAKGTTVERFPLVVTTPFFIPFMLNKPGIGEFVEGEIYEVDDKMLAKLDELEKNATIYLRTKVEIQCDDVERSTKSCDAYLLNDFLESLLQLPRLKSYADGSQYISPREKERTDEEVCSFVKRPLNNS